MTTNTKFCLSFLFHQLTRSSDPGVNLTLAHDIQLLIAFIGFPGKFKDTSFFIALNCAGSVSWIIIFCFIKIYKFHDSPGNDWFQFHMKVFLAKITQRETCLLLMPTYPPSLYPRDTLIASCRAPGEVTVPWSAREKLLSLHRTSGNIRPEHGAHTLLCCPFLQQQPGPETPDHHQQCCRHCWDSAERAEQEQQDQACFACADLEEEEETPHHHQEDRGGGEPGNKH